uniref:Uncharacterized protein n=1 Tax=Gasterosteus aculeatus aculeatus TaxID=481459 RepID=A0AAQ4PQL0_GASAC
EKLVKAAAGGGIIIRTGLNESPPPSPSAATGILLQPWRAYQFTPRSEPVHVTRTGTIARGMYLRFFHEVETLDAGLVPAAPPPPPPPPPPSSLVQYSFWMCIAHKHPLK